MRNKLAQIVIEAKDFTSKKAAAQKKLDFDVADVQRKFSREYVGKAVDGLQERFQEDQRPQFERVIRMLNQELDAMESTVKRQIEESKPENYDLKLSNLLQMLTALDKGAVGRNISEIQKAIQGFGYDPIARETIASILNSKGVMMAGGMFDDSKARMLDSLKDARRFADSGFDNPLLGENMEWYFENHFEDFKE